MPRNQLFIISRAARMSLDPDEVKATCDALKELGLYALPYPEVDIWIAADGFASTNLSREPLIEGGNETIADYLNRGLMVRSPTDPKKVLANFGPGSWIEYHNISLEHENFTKVLCFAANKHIANQRLRLDRPTESVPNERSLIADGLITLLATRNAVKEIEHNKCVRLGIGTKKHGKRSYEYVTTIMVPDEGERPPAEGPGEPGREVAPHLRRGHIRHQRFGPNYELAKLIWIAPVIVNADKGWVATRRAYNMGGP